MALVNAAGYGKFTSFAEMDMASQLGIVELNDRALTAMCHMSLPYMHPGSKIINLGSNSAWQPVPYMSVYGASKGLCAQLLPGPGPGAGRQDIQVLCVCPGWVKTEFMDRAVHDSTVSFFDRWYESEDVVEKAMRDLRKGRDRVHPGISRADAGAPGKAAAGAHDHEHLVQAAEKAVKS